jgi:hypothetical protein
MNLTYILRLWRLKQLQALEPNAPVQDQEIGTEMEELAQIEGYTDGFNFPY